MAGATTCAEFYAHVKKTIVHWEQKFWVNSALAATNPLLTKLKGAKRKLINALTKALPTGDSKDLYQTYFVENLAKLNTLSPLETTRSVVDTHKTAFLDGRKPDITIYDGKYEAQHPVLLVKAIVVGEIKPLSSAAGTFTESALGEVLTFGLRHLENAPHASEVTCFVTNCHMIQFFRLCRGPNDSIVYHTTDVLPLGINVDTQGNVLSIEKGTLCLWELLTATPHELRCALPDVPPGVEIVSLMGQGTFGAVYEASMAETVHQDSARVSSGDQQVAQQDQVQERRSSSRIAKQQQQQHPTPLVKNTVQCALKVLKNDALHTNAFNYEVTQLKALPRHDGLPQFLFNTTSSSHHVIATLPIGQDIRCLLREHVVSIVNALKSAHDAGLVHRDLKPANLLFVPSNYDTGYGLQGLIIDWGCAGSIGRTQHGLIGTLEYCACSILASVARNRQGAYEFTPQTDLESLLMSFLVIMFKTIRQSLAIVQPDRHTQDRAARAKALHTFWSNIIDGSKTEGGPQAWSAVAAAHNATMENPPDYTTFAVSLSSLLPPTPAADAFPQTLQKVERN